MATRKPYPSDVSDEEWAFVAPYLALVREDAPQREHDLREVFDALRWVVRTRSAWRYMPHDLPPWEAVYQQTQRWIKAGVFEEMVHDLRVLLRLSKERASEPSAAILDSRTLRSTPESGPRGGYDGHKGKRKRRSKTSRSWSPSITQRSRRRSKKTILKAVHKKSNVVPTAQIAFSQPDAGELD